MKKIMKAIKIIVILIAVLLLVCGAYYIVKVIGVKGTVSPEIWSDSDQFDPSKINQVVKSDGEDFKILLFSDIQLGANPFNNKKALEMMDGLVAQTEPDFIMTTGDNTYLFFSDFMVRKVIEKMQSYGIPWGVTLGNHDSEGVADRNWHGNQYESAENSLFEMGPDNIRGVGNYVVNVVDTNGAVCYSLIMMDSNEKRKYESGWDYDYIHSDQIEWYEWVVSGQRETPSMLFFHIPLPEFEEASVLWQAGEMDSESGFGESREGVFAAPVNSGLFDKVKQYDNTSHIFVGHDHINSLSVEFEGVWLTYGLKTGPANYHDRDLQGGTLITIKDGSNEVVIQHIYYTE